MGRAAVLPSLTALTRTAAPASPPPAGVVTVDAALERLQLDVRKLAAGVTSVELTSLALILDDRRFRDRLGAAAASASPLKSMSELAREYAKVAFAAAGD